MNWLTPDQKISFRTKLQKTPEIIGWGSSHKLTVSSGMSLHDEIIASSPLQPECRDLTPCWVETWIWLRPSWRTFWASWSLTDCELWMNKDTQSFLHMVNISIKTLFLTFSVKDFQTADFQKSVLFFLRASESLFVLCCDEKDLCAGCQVTRSHSL